jgi:DNA-binding winged helix-turn-helix (wHTH) protein/TolB-like protein/tetratricopeptide (TPR) repeat protein
MGQFLVFRFGDFVLDGSQRRLLRSGEDVYLPPKTFELLLHLLQNRGRVLTKDELLEAVWPDVNVVENTLAQRIREIREALRDDAHGGRFIKTVPKVGYQFIGELDDEPPGVMPPPALASLEAAGTVPIVARRDVGTNVPANQRQQLPLSVAIACVMLLGLVGAGYFVATARPAQPPGSPAAVTSIAVLPFKPLVPEGRDAALELGMADSLIMKLGSLRQITVRPLSAVRRYTGAEQDAMKAGRELRVESVLEGHIQRLQDRIRVSVSLRRVRDGQQLWADQFDEQWTSIFAAQDVVSQRVAAALALALTGEEQRQLTKRYTHNPDAYGAYVRGRYFWNTGTAEGHRKAVEDFQRAIALDPGYALAFAGLADSYNLLGSYGEMPMRESHPKARTAALRALELDDKIAEAHTSLGAIITGYYWEWAEAEKHLRRALALNPNYAMGHEWYSEYLSRMARHDEAISAAQRAREIDSVSLSANSHVGLAFYLARRYDEAIEQLRDTLELNPDLFTAHLILGLSLVQQRMYGEAIAALQKARVVTRSSPDSVGLLGYGYGMAGMKREARDALKELDQLSQNHRYVSPFCKVMVYIGLGEKDRAFEWLERAYEERIWQLGMLVADPMFDPLRSDPRYTDLLRRMNLTRVAES